MGSTQLAGMLGSVDAETALDWHLTGNIFPPCNGPADLAMAQKAIDLCKEGNGDEPVIVKLGDCDVEAIESNKGAPLTNEEKEAPVFLTNPDGEKATADDLVEDWHLEFFVEGDEDDDDDEEPRKFYRHVVMIEVLSERELTDAELNIPNLYSEMQDGELVGIVTTETANEEMDGKTTADKLYAMGSEPAFFQLNDDGTPLDED